MDLFLIPKYVKEANKVMVYNGIYSLVQVTCSSHVDCTINGIVNINIRWVNFCLNKITLIFGIRFKHFDKYY